MHEEFLVFTIVLIVLVVYRLFYVDYTAYFRSIPKRIWTYYETPLNPTDADHAIHTRFDTWRRLNPECEVIVLTRANAAGYLPIPLSLLTHPLIKDKHFEHTKMLIRYKALLEGGIWLDPIVDLSTPLADWVFPRYGDIAFTGSRKESGHGRELKDIWSIDFRLVACTPSHPFIQRMYDEWIQILDFSSVEEYVASRVRWGAVDVLMISDPFDRTDLVAAQTIFQIQPLEKKVMDRMILHSSIQ